MAGIVPKKSNHKIRRPHGCRSVSARKKKIGRVILRARPKSLLSESMEKSGPYSLKFPPVVIMKGMAFRINRPKEAAITIRTSRRRSRELTIRTVAYVMTRIIETNFHRAHVSAEWLANRGVSLL